MKIKSIIILPLLLFPFLINAQCVDCEKIAVSILEGINEIDSLHNERKRLLLEGKRTPNELFNKIKTMSIHLSTSIVLYIKVKKCSQIDSSMKLNNEILMHDYELLLLFHLRSRSLPSDTKNGNSEYDSPSSLSEN